MDVFEKEILPSKKITPPLKKQKDSKTTIIPEITNRVVLTSVDKLTTFGTTTPKLTTLTTKSSTLTTEEPLSLSTNELTELSSTITPELKFIKKSKLKNIVSKPVVEQLPEEMLKTAVNSQESRRAPVRVSTFARFVCCALSVTHSAFKMFLLLQLF